MRPRNPTQFHPIQGHTFEHPSIRHPVCPSQLNYCAAFSRQADKNDLFGLKLTSERARARVVSLSLSLSLSVVGLLFWVRRPGQCPGSGPSEGHACVRVDCRTPDAPGATPAMNIIQPNDRPTDIMIIEEGECPQKSPQEHLPALCPALPYPSSQIVAATQACHKPLRQPRRLHRLITTTWGSREEGDVRVLMLQRDMKSRLYPVLVVVQ